MIQSWECIYCHMLSLCVKFSRTVRGAHIPCSMIQGSSTYMATGLLLLGTSTLSCRERLLTPLNIRAEQKRRDKRKTSYLSAHRSSPPLLAHLIGAHGTEHLSVSLHLHRLAAGCRTGAPWFCFRADIDEILPVCVSPCRGLGVLAQSKALVWSPGSDGVLRD